MGRRRRVRKPPKFVSIFDGNLELARMYLERKTDFYVEVTPPGVGNPGAYLIRSYSWDGKWVGVRFPEERKFFDGPNLRRIAEMLLEEWDRAYTVRCLSAPS